ncbi:MAG: short-chain dehydrogenase/reductase [Novosphingobium lindaniclasticum]|jgi:hypothetical protein|uniref:hypothetical protein n=1 Tax=Novosphingobium lindaniclasticum TaxID=1329895 RepID=UPI0024096C7F|nr:hypothetical protein [Novosphingobium lindaniclasticum]MDF2639668.1 short-chain dehydrogenase/reductase [Novosphingobium lindaniclasticum]
MPMSLAACAAPERPARTIVWLATDPELGGKGCGDFHDLAGEQPAPQTMDVAEAEKLRRESERILADVLQVAS